MSAAASTSITPMGVEKNFLQALINAGTLLNVYLVTGIRLQGYLLSFDTYTLLLKSSQANSKGCLVLYKQAISTISRGSPD